MIVTSTVDSVAGDYNEPVDLGIRSPGPPQPSADDLISAYKAYHPEPPPYYLATPDQPSQPPEQDLQQMQQQAYQTPQDSPDAIALRQLANAGLDSPLKVDEAAYQRRVTADPTVPDQYKTGAEGSIGSVQGSPHRTTLQAAADLANEPFRIAGDVIRPTANAVTDPLINALPEKVGPIPVAGPAEAARDFAVSSAPYAIPGTQTLGIAGMELQTAASLEAYKDGKIDGSQLTKALAVQLGPLVAMHVGPKVIEAGRASAGDLAGVLRSPDGAQLIERMKSEGGGGAPLNPGGEPVQPGQPAAGAEGAPKVSLPAGDNPPPPPEAQQSFGDMLNDTSKTVEQIVAEGRARGFSEQEIADGLRKMQQSVEAKQAVSPAAQLPPEAEKLGLGEPAASLPPEQQGHEPPVGGDLATRLERPAGQNSAMTPPEHQELIAALRDIIPTAADKNAELKTGRARQFGNRQDAINAALAEGKSNKEALQAGKRAMSGDILTRRNLMGVFTDERVDGYYGDIRTAENAGRITSPEAIAAHNGLDLLTTGTRSNGNHGPIMDHEAKAMSRVFGPDILGALPTAPAKMTAFQKWFAPIHIYRSWKTGMDDSFGFGQGWKIMFSDKGAFAKGKASGWKAALSDEQGAEAIMENLRQNSPTFIRGQSADRPLPIMTTGAGTNPAEEFLSPVTRRVPILSRGERSFTVGGNVMRQLALDRKAMLWERANPGKTVPDDVFQTMIDMVGQGTGWGHLSPTLLGEWKGPLSQTLFSARAKAALFQYPITLAKAMAPGADPTLRKMAAGDFAAWIAGNGAVLGAASGMASLAAYVGYSVPGGSGAQVNPLGKNFGQIKFGPQRFDIWQGASPIVRLVIQSALAAQQGDWKTPGKLGLNYGRNQLAPAPAIPADYFVGGGKNTVGVSQGSKEYWLNAASPLFIADAADSLKQLGPLGIPGALASFEGMRVNTYGNSASQDATAAVTALNDKLGQAGFQPITDRRATADKARADYIKKYGGTHAQDQAARDYYDKQASVKTYHTTINNDELKFWRGHKDLLKEVYDYNQGRASGSTGVALQITDKQVKQILGIR